MDQSQEKRSATRVECDLPILLRFGANERVTGTLTDISRLGVCLRIPGEVLGVHRLSSLVQVARQVSTVLGARFDGWLGGGEGGISRTMQPVRICQRNWQSRDVELGCALNSALDDAELERMGVSLPPLDPEVPVGDPQRARIAHWSEESGTSLRAHGEEFVPLGATIASDCQHVGYMVAQDSLAGSPMQGFTQLVTAQDAILVVPSFERTRFAGMDIAALVLAFGESYGERPMLRVLKGARQLWAGSVRLTEVEIPASGMGPMRLRMQFEDPLGTSDRTLLGVA